MLVAACCEELILQGYECGMTGTHRHFEDGAHERHLQRRFYQLFLVGSQAELASEVAAPDGDLLLALWLTARWRGDHLKLLPQQTFCFWVFVGIAQVHLLRV